ncbi:S1C family serine protease [Paenibacillus bovis]|uniref:Peptidase S1 n=1 Tax=Paenibacillus bovis TaxID=1616788 RepID=A0A172ZKH9_9BACL|nr:trypsin-like peptidase domain-containing protein [Paenibacillus bovis]ANF98151.1 peptidase S1 [Paenibacillus bovis]
MNKGWIISIVSSVLIVGAGLGGYAYINRTIPAQLTTKPLLAATASSAASKPNSLKTIIHESQKKVVMIRQEDGILGSGFLYNTSGDVITNAHVVAGTKNVEVKTADARSLKGTVIGIGTDTDIAVVRVPELADTKPLALAAASKADVGDNVLALGSPLGFQNTVTTGIISGVGRDLTIDPYIYRNLYQISAPIAPGNSGGPLIDAATGEVIGINSAAATESNSIGFSIPVSEIKDMVTEWSAHPVQNLPKTASTDTGAGEEQLSLTDEAEYVVSYFYDSLNARDYVTAYSLLGSRWQGKLAYAKFREGYLNTGTVTVDRISSEREGDQAIVSMRITAEERKDTGTVYTSYQINYTAGYENNVLKILSGKAEKVK